MSAYMLINNNFEFRTKKRDFANERPWCARCRTYVKKKQRTVDHIVPMSIYLGLATDKSNWQMLCVTCHQRKTARIDNHITDNTLRFAFINAKQLK